MLEGYKGMKRKYYCLKCDKAITRLEVQNIDEGCVCSLCGSRVVKIQKIREAITKDYIEYAIGIGKIREFM